HRFEFVIVTTSALKSEAQKCRAEQLHVSFKNSVTIHFHLERIAITFGSAIRSVAPEMRRDERVHHLRSEILAGRIADEFVAGNLFLNETVERLIRIERANDIIPIFPRHWTIRIRAE